MGEKERMAGWMDGWLDWNFGWIGGLMDGWIVFLSSFPSFGLHLLLLLVLHCTFHSLTAQVFIDLRTFRDRLLGAFGHRSQQIVILRAVASKLSIVGI